MYLSFMVSVLSVYTRSMCEMWKIGSSLEGSEGILTKTSFRNTGYRKRERDIWQILCIVLSKTHKAEFITVYSSLTVLYILCCAFELGLKSLSVLDENCLEVYVRSRKSLNRKAQSSLLLLVLCSLPLCSSFRGPRQLVRELKTRC